MADQSQLSSMITGFRLSAALGVAAQLGISDLLADGRRSVSELATAASADEDTLRRLLRALATVGMYDGGGAVAGGGPRPAPASHGHGAGSEARRAEDTEHARSGVSVVCPAGGTSSSTSRGATPIC